MSHARKVALLAFISLSCSGCCIVMKWRDGDYPMHETDEMRTVPPRQHTRCDDDPKSELPDC